MKQEICKCKNREYNYLRDSKQRVVYDSIGSPIPCWKCVDCEREYPIINTQVENTDTKDLSKCSPQQEELISMPSYKDERNEPTSSSVDSTPLEINKIYRKLYKETLGYKLFTKF